MFSFKGDSEAKKLQLLLLTEGDTYQNRCIFPLITFPLFLQNSY